MELLTNCGNWCYVFIGALVSLISQMAYARQKHGGTFNSITFGKSTGITWLMSLAVAFLLVPMLPDIESAFGLGNTGKVLAFAVGFSPLFYLEKLGKFLKVV